MVGRNRCGDNEYVECLAYCAAPSALLACGACVCWALQLGFFLSPAIFGSIVASDLCFLSRLWVEELVAWEG